MMEGFLKVRQNFSVFRLRLKNELASTLMRMQKQLLLSQKKEQVLPVSAYEEEFPAPTKEKTPLAPVG